MRILSLMCQPHPNLISQFRVSADANEHISKLPFFFRVGRPLEDGLGLMLSPFLVCNLPTSPQHELAQPETYPFIYRDWKCWPKLNLKTRSKLCKPSLTKLKLKLVPRYPKLEKLSSSSRQSLRSQT